MLNLNFSANRFKILLISECGFPGFLNLGTMILRMFKFVSSVSAARAIRSYFTHNYVG